MTSLSYTVSDALAMTRRNLIRYVRIPTLLVFSTVQPIMFVLLFAYVFGGAIKDCPGVKYIDFLMPASSSRRSSSVPPRPGSAWPRTCPRA